MTTILITGANRGIGAELMKVAGQHGLTTIGTARQPEGVLWPVNVTDEASLKAAADRMGNEALDILVCNAGIYADKGKSLEETTAQDWADSLAVNTTGVFLTIRAFLPHLRRAKRPRIAVMASIMASSARAPGGSLAYRASKAAAVNLACNLATDLRSDGIAVAALHPGWVRTEMGGGEADIDVEESAAGLFQQITSLSLENTGGFRSYDGSEIAF
ncbi:SDR family oxidoreductase [Halovulum sp. GXIMD14793]